MSLISLGLKIYMEESKMIKFLKKINTNNDLNKIYLPNHYYCHLNPYRNLIVTKTLIKFLILEEYLLNSTFLTL
jgi:hypothetical protein